MQQTIDILKQQFTLELDNAKTVSDLESLKVKYLGKKGPIQDLMKGLKEVSAESRPAVGKVINDLKVYTSDVLDDRLTKLMQEEESQRLMIEKIDVSLPGRRRYTGRKHIVTQALDEMIDIAISMGFSVQYGPDIDTDYYNFGALNFASDHPARDMQDTFYISPNVLLRTHTSNIQARIMESQRPPIRIAAPGRVYRNETITARSHVIFHQIEAVYIDIGVTFADLQAAMREFLTKLFHEEVETRFRPSYFPFVEPGMEVDIRCLSCRGSGCGLCKHTGWLEVGGAGMIHPEVLKNGAIDPEIYTGFAWGMGVERLILLKYGVKDIRMFTENDMRFLQQFASA
ncbi:MAG: phenylalanine--tRNA ligase subunit alpha [Parachlamydiaceae bacterium]|nr:phenylalanine--tRNA ligase subunit alpha [Parachlamydiaceae bacterium]